MTAAEQQRKRRALKNLNADLCFVDDTDRDKPIAIAWNWDMLLGRITVPIRDRLERAQGILAAPRGLAAAAAIR